MNNEEKDDSSCILSLKSNLKRPYNETLTDYNNKKNGNNIDDNECPRLSFKYKDKNIKLSNDRLSATGYKGWTSVFGTHGASYGKWYFEVKINEDNDKCIRFVGYDTSNKLDVKGHIRVGYACRYQRYDMPIGINNFDGRIVNNRKKHPYAIPFGPGDTIGCYISLEDPTTHFIDPRKNLKLYEFLRNGMLCDPRNIPKSDYNSNSFVQFSVNGKMFPKSELIVYDGFYHPAVSLYMGATVTINFGPDFTYKPPDEYKASCLMDKPLIS